jgi:hypothetical protein
MPLYPKLSNQAIARSKGFDPDVPSPLGQAFTRRMSEQQQADIKARDMKLSPLDKAVAGLESAMMMGSMMFEAIQQAPKLLQGEDAYTTAIGNRVYQPRMYPEKSAEYIGDVIDLMDKAQTEYKIPPIMPELAGFQPLMQAANQQVKQGVNQAATNAGMALEKSLDKPVTNIMNRGGFGAQMLGSFDTQPAQVVKPKGGNWLGGNIAGGVDKRLASLKTPTIAGETPIQRIPKHEALLNDPTLNQDQLDRVRYQLEQTKAEAALDKWIESNVGNYVKKEMGTPEDPVRLMFEKRAQEIEAQFQVDMNRASRTRARAETEEDPRRQANLIRQAAREEEQAKFDRDFSTEHATHLPPYEFDEDALIDLGSKREMADFATEGMAKSKPAKRWENITDEAIDIQFAKNIQKQQELSAKAQEAEKAYQQIGNEIEDKYPIAFKKFVDERGVALTDDEFNGIIKSMPMKDKASFLGMNDEFERLQSEYLRGSRLFNRGLSEIGEENPFVSKLDPETKLYSAYLGDLGIDHVVDVIKQDVAAGRIRPDQLNKLTMDQAIKRTADFNKEQAIKMRDAVIKQTEGFPTYKDYGDEGYKWVELAVPEATLPEGYKILPDQTNYKNPNNQLFTMFDDQGNAVSTGASEAEALKLFKRQEREQQLADALKYEGDTMGHCVGGYCPDVISGKSRIYSLRDKRGEPHVTVEVKPMRGSELGRYAADLPEGEDVAAMKNPPNRIVQIKGKQNAAPKEDYLPFVQDFVRSGEWSDDVGDFKNTGLMRTDVVKKAGWDVGDIDQKYLTKQEYDDLLLKQLGTPPIEGMKAGGSVHISDNPDTMAMELEDQKYQVGGIVDIAARAAKAAKAAQLKKAMKASEALAQIEGKRLNITQADRTKVGQGFLGGPGFSGLQHQEGPHKDVGAVWGVKNVGTAKTMLGGFKDPLGKEYFTTMIGSPVQHQSNQMVFDKLYSQFKTESKKGNLDPELRDKINARLAASVDKDGNPIFPADIDILDKNFKKQATTFDQRAVTGNVLGGVGVGGKKGQIFDYDKIIRDTTDPFLLDAPSGSLGYRLWTPSGEIIERPDLHPAFPAIATGEDLGVEFNPAAQDVLMAPWVENVRQTKGRNPGYMDWTRGRPPSVEVTEDILTNLQKSGNKAGGLIKVKRKAGGGIMKKALKAAVAPATKRLEMSFKDVAKPVPELTEAAQKLKAGQLSREEYEGLVNKHKPVTPYSFVPQPATAEDATRALNSAKREKFGKTKEIPAGTPTGLRLDIPAYKDHGVWVNSVHADDMPTMYDNVSSVTNAEMVMPEDKALSVATREANKSPFAVIKGGWNPMSEEEAVARATEYLNHPDWVQVGIDPERHGYYYNRATMEPIVKAEEVIQIGPLVLAKNPTTAPKEAFKYAMGGAITGDDLILTERPL